MQPGLPPHELHHLLSHLFLRHLGIDSFNLGNDDLANVQTVDWHYWENYWITTSIAFAAS